MNSLWNISRFKSIYSAISLMSAATFYDHEIIVVLKLIAYAKINLMHIWYVFFFCESTSLAWIKFLWTAYWPTGESACQKAIWQDAVKCDCTCRSFFNFNVIWRLSFRIVENSFALFILSDSQRVLISTSFDVGACLLFNCTFSKQIHVQLFYYLCFDVLKVELFFFFIGEGEFR